jgi:hypothetical protein
MVGDRLPLMDVWIYLPAVSFDNDTGGWRMLFL